jgi:hypothetical protein
MRGSLAARFAVVSLGILCAAAPAHAQEPTRPDASSPPTVKLRLDHRYQVGLGIRFGTGYRVIIPYDEEFCGDSSKSVCSSRQPAWMELSPSFGVSESLEVLTDVRIFIEEDFTGSHAFFVAPGIKYYSDPHSRLKLYGTAQIVLESQDQREGSGLSTFDIGARSALGLQYDIRRYVGLFAQGGILVGFRRWLTFTVDFAGGVQVRY